MPLYGGVASSSMLAIVKYDPNPSVLKSPTTSVSAVDSTNLTISFTAPASGRVMVVLTGIAKTSNNTNGDWMDWCVVTHGTTTVQGSIGHAVQQVSQAGGGVYGYYSISVRIYITGLTPGASLQYDWGYITSATGASATGIQVGNDGTNDHSPAIMEIYAAV
jgi:hypothetical protein